MSKPAMTLEELTVYYRGVHFATIAMKGRLARLGPEHRSAVQAVGRYQQMANHYADALAETKKLQEEGGDAAST